MPTPRRLLLGALGASAALALLLDATSASAYTLKTTPSGAHVRWHRSTITLELAHVDEGGLARADVRAALELAASNWSAVPGVPSLVVRDAGANEPTWGVDGINGVYVLSRWPFAERRLAVTVTARDEATGALLDADILVNGEMDLELLGAEGEADRFDIALLLTHELGHLLGLDESEVREATMWSTIRTGEIERRDLSADDVDGALALYGGAPARSTVRYGCSIARASGGSRYGVAVLATFGILALRRRRHARS